VPEVERIYNDLLANYKSMAVIDPISKLTVIQIKAPYLMASFVSSAVSYMHPNETFLFYEDAGDGFAHISVRSQHSPKHLGHLMDNVSKQFEGANGGGHAPAAGGRCKNSDVDAFIEKVKQQLIS
jgi:nanoRNase/pAp phosphatase (c-di-AMP/oligoRNAs hydrolase)